MGLEFSQKHKEYEFSTDSLFLVVIEKKQAQQIEGTKGDMSSSFLIDDTYQRRIFCFTY